MNLDDIPVTHHLNQSIPKKQYIEIVTSKNNPKPKQIYYFFSYWLNPYLGHAHLLAPPTVLSNSPDLILSPASGSRTCRRRVEMLVPLGGNKNRRNDAEMKNKTSSNLS